MIAQALDYWNQYAAVTALCVFLFCYKWVAPRFGNIAALLLGTSAGSSIWFWLFVQNRYVTIEPYKQMALRYFAADSIAKIMLIAVPLMVLSENRLTFLLFGELAASFFVVGSSLFSLYEAARYGCNGLTCGGFIGNPSISMGLMVCMLPVFIRSWKRQWPVLALAAAAVFVSGSSIALGLLAAYVGLSLFPWRFDFPKMSLAAAASLAVMFVGKLALGSEFANDSDRFKIWRFMMERWSAPWNLLFGTGLGTYHVFSINLQKIPKFEVVVPGGWWNTLHNDFLQQLFECGIVGGLLLLATYGSALRKVIKERDWYIALSVALFGIYMSLDPALHNPLPVLFGAWLFIYALRKPTKEYA